MTCAGRVPFERLAGYWLGDADDALEEHLFGCEACTARLERLAALAEAVRRHAREGALRGAVTPAVLDRLAAQGVRIRRYDMPPGGSIQCTAGPRDEVVTVRLRLPGPAVTAERVDALFSSTTVAFNQRVEDVPVAADGAVHWAEPGAFLRTLPDHVLQIRLVAAGGPGGDAELARYTLNHSAWRG